MSVLEAISQMIKEYNVSKDFIADMLKDVLTNVIKSEFGRPLDIEIYISDSNIKVFIYKKVMQKVMDSVSQVSLSEAKKIDNNIKLYDKIKTDFPFDKLSRNSIIMIRNLIQEKMKEEKRKRIEKEYRKKIGEIVVGTIQKVDKNEVLVKLENDAEGIIPVREQIPNERYSQGSPIKGYILDITPEGRILFSRTHPDFLKKLLAQEIPEIKQNIIEIKGVARIPGVRAKVAVSTQNPKIDCVGACVGMKGARIQGIVKELNNEKIDIIQYSSELLVFISRCLSSVNILRNKINIEEKKATIVVSDKELPKAIGKNGHNVSLASKITGFKIDIISESEYKNKGIPFISDIPHSLKKKLIESDFVTTKDILNCDILELTKKLKIKKESAQKLINIVKSINEKSS